MTTTEGFLWTSEQSITGLDTDAVVTSTNSLNDTYDVVVVGAGFAGLTAARDLAATGRHRVLLVEARDRIGGRTWTAKALGEAFEMGGTWVHWTQPHVYREISRYGLHKNLKTSSGTAAAEQILYKDANKPIQSLDIANRTANMQKVADKCFTIDGLSSRQLMPYPHDPLKEPAPWKKYDHLTWRQRLDQLTDETQFDRDLLETEFNTIGCTTGTEIGFVEALRWYALGSHSIENVFEMAGTFKLGKGGMTSLAVAMLEEANCDIAMQAPINSIEQNDNSVCVITETGDKFKALHCICTIPLNALSTITFNPPLSRSKQEATRLGHLNRGAKIHFQLSSKQPPWFITANGYCGSSFCFAFTDHTGTSQTESTQANKTYCIGFGYNDRLPDTSDHQRVIEAFKQSLKPDVEVEAYLTHDWANDPYAKGTWSCWGPGSMTEYLEGLQQSHGRVLMASADWANGYRGFIDGAIEQGARAAMDVQRAQF